MKDHVTNNNLMMERRGGFDTEEGGDYDIMKKME
jgi:hypothetical protein